MSGKGGHKHRRVEIARKQSRERQKAKASIARARGLFEAKGQTWDPENNPAQMAALNHPARQLLGKRETDLF